MRDPGQWGERDIDTFLYRGMCIVTVPVLLLGLLFLWLAEHYVPPQLSMCMFQRVLHLYCPGCGGTRCFRALFSGRPVQALYYHPGAFYGAVLYVVYFVSQTLMRLSRGRIPGLRFRPVYLYIMLGVIGVNFAVRNVLLVFFHYPTL